MPDFNLSDLDFLVISLPAEIARKQNIEQQFSQKLPHCQWQFIEGVLGKALALPIPEYDAKKRLREHDRDLTLGEIGCFLSHRSVWQHCVNAQKTCVVFEDDVLIQDNFLPALAAAMSIADQWDIFRLHGITEKPHKNLMQLGEHQIFLNLRDPGSAAAYVIQPHAAQALLAMSNTFSLPVDDFMETPWNHHQRMLAIRPYPIQTAGFETTIPYRKPLRGSVLKRLTREFFRLPDGVRRLFWCWQNSK